MPLRSAAAGDRKREVPTQLRFVHAAVCTASIHSRRVASEMSGFRKRCFYIQPPLSSSRERAVSSSRRTAREGECGLAPKVFL